MHHDLLSLRRLLHAPDIECCNFGCFCIAPFWCRGPFEVVVFSMAALRVPLLVVPFGVAHRGQHRDRAPVRGLHLGLSHC
eukprot:15792856-Heterocapsa_arctica.AAC.1